MIAQLDLFWAYFGSRPIQLYIAGVGVVFVPCALPAGYLPFESYSLKHAVLYTSLYSFSASTTPMSVSRSTENFLKYKNLNQCYLCFSHLFVPLIYNVNINAKTC